MKVMYDHQTFSEQTYGGISRYFFEIARRITKMNDVEVGIFAPLHVNRYFRETGDLNITGIGMPRWPKTFRIRISINNLATKFYLNHFQPDIIHETYYHRKQAYSSKIPIVITIHDMIHDKFPEYFSKSDPIKRNKAKAIERASHIICVSKNTQKDLIDLFNLDPLKTTVIYHGISDAFSQSSNDRDRIVEDPYILFVGQRSKYKNFQNLLSAYARSGRLSKDFCLVCFGGGSFSKDEIDFFDKSSIDRKKIIHVTGNDTILSSLYHHAECFVFPSLYEGFGIPVLEAMSCNCPVIASEASSLPEIASFAAEYFQPNEIDGITHAIEKVIYDRDRREHLSREGLKRVESFSWEQAAGKTRSIYDGLI